jgi:hypothetical protein
MKDTGKGALSTVKDLNRSENPNDFESATIEK